MQLDQDIRLRDLVTQVLLESTILLRLHFRGDGADAFPDRHQHRHCALLHAAPLLRSHETRNVA